MVGFFLLFEYRYLRSFCSAYSVLQCVSIRLNKLLMQLVLCCVGWLLLKFSIWSVFVFYGKRVCMLIVPSLVLANKTSQNASWLFFHSSFVNCIFSMLLCIVCKILSVLNFLTVAKTSSTYMFQVLISIVISNGFSFLIFAALLQQRKLGYSKHDINFMLFFSDLECKLFQHKRNY